jgi:hypothetical protein
VTPQDEFYDLLAALRPAWKDQAACRGMRWATVVSGGRAIQAACAACVVREDCNTEAQRVQAEFGEVHGCWAGVVGSERRLKAAGAALVCPGCDSPFVRTQGKQRWCHTCRTTPGAKDRARRRLAKRTAA